MTDNEIIKALSTVTYGGHSCAKCKHKISTGEERCGIKGCNIARNAIDLINRQKAEIEHFRKVTKKVKSDSKYFLDTNEENGVVLFPKFTIDDIIKELTEKGGAE